MPKPAHSHKALNRPKKMFLMEITDENLRVHRLRKRKPAGLQVEMMAAAGVSSLLMTCMAYAPNELMDRIVDLLVEGASYSNES